MHSRKKLHCTICCTTKQATANANDGASVDCFANPMKQEHTHTNTGRSPLLTCAEGAGYIGLSKSAFWSRCRSGEIPHIRLSRRAYRVRLSDLENYLNARTR